MTKKRKTKIYTRRADGKFMVKAAQKAMNMLFFAIGASLTAVSGFFYVQGVPMPQQKFMSPVPVWAKVEPTFTPTPTPTLDPVREEIMRVFGEHGKDAIKVAKCESRLLTNAYNDNRKRGGKGEDIGLFQINNYYHPAAKKFLYDWKVNIAIAYKLFRDAGNSFSPWKYSNGCHHLLD